MKLFKEIKHILGLDENENRAWINPEETGVTRTLEDHHAADINAQFANTGIKLVEVPEKIESPFIDPDAPELTIKGPSDESIHEQKDPSEQGDGENHSTDLIPESQTKAASDEPNTVKEDLIPVSEKVEEPIANADEIHSETIDQGEVKELSTPSAEVSEPNVQKQAEHTGDITEATKLAEGETNTLNN